MLNFSLKFKSLNDDFWLLLFITTPVAMGTQTKSARASSVLLNGSRGPPFSDLNLMVNPVDLVTKNIRCHEWRESNSKQFETRVVQGQSMQTSCLDCGRSKWLSY